jgi:hypothetical protein
MMNIMIISIKVYGSIGGEIMRSLLVAGLFLLASPLLSKMAKTDTGAKVVVALGILGMIIIALI